MSDPERELEFWKGNLEVFEYDNRLFKTNNRK